MQNYTPTAVKLPATISIPQDGVDLRQVASVNSAFQDISNGVRYEAAARAILENKVDALPGVGAGYGSYFSIPATAGTEEAGYWLPSTSNGYRTGMALQSLGATFVVPVHMPLVGVVTRFSMLLIGVGPGGSHSAMPANPMSAALYRYTAQSGYEEIATCEEPAGQTTAVYDALHAQESGGVSHTIAHRDSNSWPAVYSILVTGESGANAITGGGVYAFLVYVEGVSA
jgi:hypothetical protein